MSKLQEDTLFTPVGDQQDGKEVVGDELAGWFAVNPAADELAPPPRFVLRAPATFDPYPAHGADGGNAGGGGGGGGGGGAATISIVPALDCVPRPTNTADAVLDPQFMRTWPKVEAPDDLFDLKLRGDMYPADGFIGRYLEWATCTTDAPKPFHVATALSILATVMGPQWTIEHRSGGMPGNLWCLLVARSGTRKSTATGIASRLVPLSRRWDATVESTRAFVEGLQKQPIALWCLDEAATFFDMLNKPYAADIGPKLTTAYDGKAIAYTSIRAGGTITVYDPYLSILTSAPLTWLRSKRLTSDFLQGGLWGRYILWPAARTELKLAPPPLDSKTEAGFNVWLDAIGKAQGPFRLEFEYRAQQEFLAWQQDRDALVGDLLITGVWNRAPDMVLKLCLLFHVAALRQPSERVQLDTVQQALALVQEYLLPGHLWATQRLVESSPFRRSLLELEERLETEPGGLVYSKLAKDLGVAPEALYRLLYTLQADHAIDWWRYKDEDSGRGAAVYLLTRRDCEPVGRHGSLIRTDCPPPGLQRYIDSIGEGADKQVDVTTDPLEQPFTPVLDDEPSPDCDSAAAPDQN